MTNEKNKTKKLENKVVLLLGATGGIGTKIAVQFSKLGAKMCLVARNVKKLKALSQKLKDCIVVAGDITDYETLDLVVEKILDEYGRIDVLIHAVGSILLKPLHTLSIEEFRSTLEINLVSAFYAMKAVIRPMMRQRSGNVIVLSSVAGEKGLRNHEALSAAKGGLEAMLRSAAVTYARRNIRFNGVALGLVKTPLSENAKLTSSEKAIKSSNKMHPLGRIGKPSDVVPVVEYLAGDNSSWMTGTIITLDGGIHL